MPADAAPRSSLLSPGGILRFLLLIALTVVGLAPLTSTAAQAATPTPFDCPSNFFQVSASSSGAFYKYNAASNSFSRVGTGQSSGINSAGYNTADHFIYAVNGSTLIRIDATGAYTSLGSVSGLSGTTYGGGDFYGGKLVVSPLSGNSWRAVDVSNRTSTSFTTTGSWGAYDLTVQGNTAYGLNNKTLYTVNMTTKAITTRTVNMTTASGNYGAAYSDSAGNAFFYNNSTNEVFMIAKDQLASGVTTPQAVKVGGAAATPALSAPNDGVSCPDAVSPYVPSVSGTTVSQITSNSAKVSDSAVTNGMVATAGFCLGTNRYFDPTTNQLIDCQPVSGVSPSSLSANNLSQTFSATVTGLQSCTTYYVQSVVTNVVGTTYGDPVKFTTGSECDGSAGPDPAPQPDTLDQTISFTQPTDMAFGDAPQQLTVSADSGLDVELTTSSSACSLSGNAADGYAVAALAPGTCSINANQAGDDDYNPAPTVNRSFDITKGTQTVTLEAIEDLSLDEGTTTAVANNTVDNDVTLESLTSAVCTVDPDGTVTLVKAGECTIRGFVAESANYFGDDDTVTFDVTKGSQTVTLGAVEDLSLDEGTTTIVADTSRDTAVTFESLTPLVCTVDGEGTVTLLKAGPCTILASVDADENYNGDDDTVTFDVTKGTQTVTLDEVDDINLDEDTTSVVAHNTIDNPVTLESLTVTVCTVDPDGTVTLLAAGTCTIRGYADETDDYFGDDDTVSFTVIPPFVVGTPAPVNVATKGAVSVTIPASGGTAPYSWKVAGGSTLPAGLNLNSTTGAITGSVTTPGTYTFQVAVTDANEQVQTRTVTIVVAAANAKPAPKPKPTIPAPDRGSYSPAKGGVTKVTWTSVPGAKSYKVYVGGKAVKTVKTTRVTLTKLYGPKTKVTAQTLGKNGAVSGKTRLTYKANRNAVVALVHYGSDSSALRSGDKTLLRELAKEVKAAGFKNVRITGYTDNANSYAYNKKLSLNRAAAAKNYLKSLGVKATFSTDGRSEDAPRADNKTKSGKAKNRRAEVRVW